MAEMHENKGFYRTQSKKATELIIEVINLKVCDRMDIS